MKTSIRNTMLVLGAAVAVLALPTSAKAFPVLGADTGPDVVITYNGSTFSIAYNANNGPYDGVEDTYVGVVNSSSSNTLNSLTLSGSNIFGFDGDGQSAYTGQFNDASGYAGPGTLFSIVDNSHGTVFFTGGLAAGETAWFTLEENLTGAEGSGVSISNAPDGGSTLVLLSGAMFGVGMLRRRFGV